jgi:hypothetical protein
VVDCSRRLGFVPQVSHARFVVDTFWEGKIM